MVWLDGFVGCILDCWGMLSWIRTCSTEYRALLIWMGVVRDVYVLRTEEQKTP